MKDILIVDDERDIRELISEILIDEGYQTRLSGSADECLQELKKSVPGLLILDIWLKDNEMDGIDILVKAKREFPQVPVVIISGHGNIEIAVAAIKQGAYDFIEKPFNIEQLLVVVRRAMETSRLRQENFELKRKDTPISVMVGESNVFKNFLANLDKVTKTNGRVFLTGGSGSGKEMAARYIHANSERASKPFVIVNCASIAPDRMEDVLFGRDAGNSLSSDGLLSQADGGVIYFDEIADMPLETQSKILRVLVDQKFQRVNGKSEVRVDLRVISSTSQDLREAIRQRSFREELYHRLNVVPINVPSLSQRLEDIPLLFEHFAKTFHETQGLNLRQLSLEASTMLQTMAWPGNIRQLKNMVERVLILGDGQGDVSIEDLPSETKSTNENLNNVASGPIATMPLREAREAFEREYLITQINRFNGNISKTAKFVGMERSALHRKLKSLGVVSISRTQKEDG
jgi:two-component system nitrogen regulation response regulator NtrX|tara:strand:- start:98 stop:1480 length:1383 start_codon:yes stop_codon:yes gene_type:complete